MVRVFTQEPGKILHHAHQVVTHFDVTRISQPIVFGEQVPFESAIRCQQYDPMILPICDQNLAVSVDG